MGVARAWCADRGGLVACADNTPRANVLAYGKGYVELKGQTVRVIPHVMNLESCARHCEVDEECTHWRRCAGVCAPDLSMPLSQHPPAAMPSKIVAPQ